MLVFQVPSNGLCANASAGRNDKTNHSKFFFNAYSPDEILFLNDWSRLVSIAPVERHWCDAILVGQQTHSRGKVGPQLRKWHWALRAMTGAGPHPLPILNCDSVNVNHLKV